MGRGEVGHIVLVYLPHSSTDIRTHAISNSSSQAVSRPCTIGAQCCWTSLIERAIMHSSSKVEKNDEDNNIFWPIFGSICLVSSKTNETWLVIYHRSGDLWMMAAFKELLIRFNQPNSLHEISLDSAAPIVHQVKVNAAFFLMKPKVRWMHEKLLRTQTRYSLGAIFWEAKEHEQEKIR